MAEERSFTARISSGFRGAPRNLTVAELGVLLTGINRAVNKTVDSSQDYFPLVKEPTAVHLEISRVDSGSVVLKLLTDSAVLSVLSSAIVGGVVGNAAYDFVKILSKEAARALRRVGTRVEIREERVDPWLNGVPEDGAVLIDNTPQIDSPDRIPSNDNSNIGDDRKSTFSIEISIESNIGLRKVKVSLDAIIE